MRIDAKVAARQWILNAIQNHPCIPNKETEREITKFVGRLQRDLKQLIRSRDLFIALNSQDGETKAQAIKELRREPGMNRKGRERKVRRHNAELVRLVQSQREDANDRTIRFERAIQE